jgi:hypothetical protein
MSSITLMPAPRTYIPLSSSISLELLSSLQAV